MSVEPSLSSSKADIPNFALAFLAFFIALKLFILFLYY